MSKIKVHWMVNVLAEDTSNLHLPRKQFAVGAVLGLHVRDCSFHAPTHPPTTLFSLFNRH